VIRNLWISLLLWPCLAHAQWVQVGFLSSEQNAAAPQNVVLASQAGEWQKEISLRERYNVKFGCMVSEPLVLPKLKSGPLAVRWEQGGMQFCYEFDSSSDHPIQILLDQPKSGSEKSVDGTKSEAVLTVAPNPFNPVSNISLTLPSAAHVRLEIFDILGRQVTLLNDSKLSTGTHHWVADGSLWASGTYFLSYRLSPGQSGVRRMQLLK
jgi:hypothetical protein